MNSNDDACLMNGRRAAPAARLGRPIHYLVDRSFDIRLRNSSMDCERRAATRSAQLEMQSRAWLRRHKARLGLFFRVMTSALAVHLKRLVG